MITYNILLRLKLKHHYPVKVKYCMYNQFSWYYYKWYSLMIDDGLKLKYRTYLCVLNLSKL